MALESMNVNLLEQVDTELAISRLAACDALITLSGHADAVHGSLTEMHIARLGTSNA